MSDEFDTVWRRVTAAGCAGMNIGFAHYAKHKALARYKAGKGIGGSVVFGVFAITMAAVHVQLIRELEAMELSHPNK